ncbi:tubulin-like doman-containing protein [Anabaenopsis elenkinii]|uniref:Tubulin-like doman-containing protein n=1 Tax=Anabaenopsis elenkinii CCIBt3563 TaxID=2779889 RepID=A0A7U3NM33_9CYAN|nr:tubulin-like doman-containing protein [Anabaenopsis elenkinii]QOV21834.1 tubulin-like doman-containing protein [Anabaenopsis elenkinii CCIBt3563]
MPDIQEKTMVPTVLLGIGGTGYEVLSRIRRLVEQTYGRVGEFPIISFLVVDTDSDYKIDDPLAAGSPFENNEKYWSRVTGDQVTDMVRNMSNFPWIDNWFPDELERNIGALEAGAGQIRACGRFAFFCNYKNIRQKFNDACKRVKAKEDFMSRRYGVNLLNSKINVFIVGSISGGTGSGMLIDMGYCVRHWLKEQGEASPSINMIVPMPTVFAGINAGERISANGYAALMELNYFSDYRTEYSERFSDSLEDKVTNKSAPADFIYLVGHKNGKTEFTLGQIREMIAQNIFLDLTSDFSPYKRSIRDNIKTAWATQDPGGRGYPKNFLSFGLSTIEIPIDQIRKSMASRLAVDLVDWWLNESIYLPPNLSEVVQSTLKVLRLSNAEMIIDLSAATDRSYTAEVSNWINSIANRIKTENQLECTRQGVNFLNPEQGNILNFVQNLEQVVNDYRTDHLNEIGIDERLHGDYLQKMYSNRNRIIQQGQKALETEISRIIADRTQGPKFVDAFIDACRQFFTNMSKKFNRDVENIWEKNEEDRQTQYKKALENITQSKNEFIVNKQDKMQQYCKEALEGVEGFFGAIIQKKARVLGLQVINQLLEHLQELELRFMKLKQIFSQIKNYFQQEYDREINNASALLVNGIKLFERSEINDIYTDLIEQQISVNKPDKTRYESGMNNICSLISDEILKDVKQLYINISFNDEVMPLFKVSDIPDIKQSDFFKIIFEKVQVAINKSPDTCILKSQLTAGDRFLLKHDNNRQEMKASLNNTYQKSYPLILLSQAVLGGQDAGFTPSKSVKVALLGGNSSGNSAIREVIKLIKPIVEDNDPISPLGYLERHRIVFVQEQGGFSLRCIDGMRVIQKSYQDWKGKMILAKRAQLRGENKDLPIPVHIQKEPPFWDIFPEDPSILKLVVQARALQVLNLEHNPNSGKKVIRYTHSTQTGKEKVDIASTWEEAVQVLGVDVCSDDKAEIQRQINQKLDLKTEEDKQKISNRLQDYLRERISQMTHGDAENSLEYRREKDIIGQLIKDYQLPVIEVKADPDEPILDPPESLLQQLEQLIKMKEAGYLSAEEFKNAKEQLGL